MFKYKQGKKIVIILLIMLMTITLSSILAVSFNKQEDAYAANSYTLKLSYTDYNGDRKTVDLTCGWSIQGSSQNTVTGERIEESIKLDSDKVIEVRVEAKRYNVVVEEYIYRDLSEQESGTPSREENPINGIEMGGQGYGENATLRFSKGNTDRELTKIVLTETGIGKIELTIRDGVYEVSGEGEIEGTENGYIIRIGEKEYTLIDNEDTIELRYETEDNITLRLEYTSLKEISP